MSELTDNIRAVQQRIDQAADRAGRNPAEVTLVAVTKTWPIDVLEAAYAAGLRHFGENRTHELDEKRPALEASLGVNNGIVWHYIGHLQSRQSRSVADKADLFHAADRPKIIQRLTQQTAENRRTLPLLLEVNISGEESKGGFEASDWQQNQDRIDQLSQTLKAIKSATNLTCEGLMTMAPWGADPAFIRSVFRKTRELKQTLEDKTGIAMPVLSMGMTDDFDLAIEEGATHIRVGRALFGSRATK